MKITSIVHIKHRPIYWFRYRVILTIGIPCVWWKIWLITVSLFLFHMFSIWIKCLQKFLSLRKILGAPLSKRDGYDRTVVTRIKILGVRSFSMVERVKNYPKSHTDSALRSTTCSQNLWNRGTIYIGEVIRVCLLRRKKSSCMIKLVLN